MSKRRREKITFTCVECGKERTINKENYPEDEVCSYCKSRKPKTTPEGSKRCRICGEVKHLAEFNRRSSSSDGFDNECKICHAERKRRWRESKNTLHKKPKKTAVQKPKQKSKKEIIPISSNRNTFPNIKRRNLKEGDDNTITNEYLENIKGDYCERCGKRIDTYNIDYIIPPSQGGTYVKANIRYICDTCKKERPEDGRDVLGYFPLDPSYSDEEQKREFSNIQSRNHGYKDRPHTNRIVLSNQPHFYEVEKELWKDWEVRRFIYLNRIKYINRSPDLLNNRELLRAFKISGRWYGFSHFSPYWIKSFIEEYDISSVYDPCGGWGHRLLGAWNIDYFYNDYDERTVAGVKNIYEKFKESNKTEKKFFNEDASEFSPDLEYEAIFTCPPYFKKEEYTSDGTSTDKYSTYYDWINVWWRKVIRNTNPSKYFAFVIDADLREDMSDVVEQEGYTFREMKILGKSKSHFTRGRNEVLLIFDKE